MSIEKGNQMSPRSIQANQRLHEEQKKRILSAALPVFVQKGLAATRMADIAAAAEMGYGSVYHYFPDKEAIFTALIQEMIQSSIQHAQEALALPGSPWERLQWWFSRTITWVRKHPEITLFIAQVLTNEQEHRELRQLVYQLSRAAQKELRQLIVEGQEAGQVVSGNPDQLAMAIQSCLHGLAIEATFDPDQTREDFPQAEMLLRLLKA
jgi:AcrR family transcriptional regulator